jgi:hypothetical protein
VKYPQLGFEAVIDWVCYTRTKNDQFGIQVSEEDLLNSLYECIQSTAKGLVNSVAQQFVISLWGVTFCELAM